MAGLFNFQLIQLGMTEAISVSIAPNWNTTSKLGHCTCRGLEMGYFRKENLKNFFEMTFEVVLFEEVT